MVRVRLIHWNAEEGKERAARLRALGHVVACEAPSGAEDLKRYGRSPPDVFVIDLERLPSHGREIGNALRRQRATRHVPLLFVGGDASKVTRVKALLPDAAYASWRGIRGGLRRALERPPAAPVVPGTMAGYAKTPLPRKLGIREGTRVRLVGAPRAFDATLGSLPEGARLRRRGTGDVVLLFAERRSALQQRLPSALAARATDGRLWLAWPKKTSGRQTDLGEREVRVLGLASGLVDFKICAIDETWSGLCFGRPRG